MGRSPARRGVRSRRWCGPDASRATSWSWRSCRTGWRGPGGSPAPDARRHGGQRRFDLVDPVDLDDDAFHPGGDGAADGFLTLFALCWTGIFLFFPLFNRDRLRVGDLLAGTWVVNTVRAKLGEDLVATRAQRPHRVFTDAALDLYGIYELQTLENVLRNGQDDAIVTVAATIRRKAGLPDDGDDYAFLSDYYAALCARLERGMLVGRRREDKHASAGRR